MNPKSATVFALVFPVAPAAALLWGELRSAAPLALPGYALTALGALAFVLGVRYFLPGYSLEPNRWGLVAGLAAVWIYLAGSLNPVPALHWAGAAMLYLAGVLYLGGPVPALVALPGALSFFAALSGLAGSTFVGVPVAAALVAYSFAVFPKGRSQTPCSQCGGYASRGLAFCYLCGRNLGVPSLAVPKGKLAVVAGVSAALVLLAFVQPVALKASPSGIAYATYSITGTSAAPLLAGLPAGWKVTNVTVESTPEATSDTYQLSHSGANVSLLVTLAAYPYVSPPTSGNLTQVTLTGNESQAKFGVSGVDQPLTGLAWASPISYLSGGQVSSGLVSILAAEPSSAFATTGGADLRTLSSSLQRTFQSSLLWSFPLATVGGYILQYEAFIVPSVGLAAVLVFVGSLRGRELKDGRVVDGAYGLSQQEFALYASMVTAPANITGSAYEWRATSSGAWKGGDFGDELARLERLGLTSAHVRVRRGVPRLLWKCELT